MRLTIALPAAVDKGATDTENMAADQGVRTDFAGVSVVGIAGTAGLRLDLEKETVNGHDPDRVTG